MIKSMLDTRYVKRMENRVISKIKKANEKAKEILKQEKEAIDLNEVFDNDEIIDMFIKEILLSKLET